MEQYYKTMQGYEVPSPSTAPGADGTLQMVKVPGDRKKAIFDALASNHPALRDLAMQQLKEEGKNQLTPKDLLSIATPESVLANTSNPAAWKPKRELKAYAPGEVLLDSSGNYATPGNPSGPLRESRNPAWFCSTAPSRTSVHHRNAGSEQPVRISLRQTSFLQRNLPATLPVHSHRKV